MIQPCIRCGECAPACPADLDPQLLLAALRRDEPSAAQALGLQDCTGCAACDARCPSGIPLAARFTAARDALRQERQRQAFAEISRQRFEARDARLRRREEELAAERQRQRAANASAQAVAAALARARAKRPPDATDPA